MTSYQETITRNGKTITRTKISFGFGFDS